MYMPLAPCTVWAMDFAASSDARKASTERMSGCGKPLRTPTPTMARAKARRLAGRTMPASASSFTAPVPSTMASPGSPARILATMALAESPLTETLLPVAFS